MPFEPTVHVVILQLMKSTVQYWVCNADIN